MICAALCSRSTESTEYVWDRHLEQSEVWESTLNKKAVEVPETVEEIVFRNIQNEKVHRAIEQLPEVQKRRIVMYCVSKI